MAISLHVHCILQELRQFSFIINWMNVNYKAVSITNTLCYLNFKNKKSKLKEKMKNNNEEWYKSGFNGINVIENWKTKLIINTTQRNATQRNTTNKCVYWCDGNMLCVRPSNACFFLITADYLLGNTKESERTRYICTFFYSICIFSMCIYLWNAKFWYI